MCLVQSVVLQQQEGGQRSGQVQPAQAPPQPPVPMVVTREKQEERERQLIAALYAKGHYALALQLQQQFALQHQQQGASQQPLLPHERDQQLVAALLAAGYPSLASQLNQQLEQQRQHGQLPLGMAAASSSTSLPLSVIPSSGPGPSASGIPSMAASAPGAMSQTFPSQPPSHPQQYAGLVPGDLSSFLSSPTNTLQPQLLGMSLGFPQSQMQPTAIPSAAGGVSISGPISSSSYGVPGSSALDQFVMQQIAAAAPQGLLGSEQQQQQQLLSSLHLPATGGYAVMPGMQGKYSCSAASLVLLMQ